MHLGLPVDLLEVIMHCITSADLCINWQGSVTDSIKPSRGLRQGDPISPYLFFLCLERLGHRIMDSVETGDWIPFKFGRGLSPSLSHICFAEDLILVAEASMDQVHNIKHILNDFCTASGQKISYPKSNVFFSANVQDRDVAALSQALGVQTTDDLGRYLGAPMLHQRVSAQSYRFVLDKMQKKLSG